MRGTSPSGPGAGLGRRLDRLWFSRQGRATRLTGSALAEALFPAACAACGREGSAFCGACLSRLRAGLVAPRVVDDLADLDVLAPRSPAPVTCCAPYTGVLAAALLAAKRPSGLPLLRRLGPGLARALRLAATAAAATAVTAAAAPGAQGAGPHGRRRVVVPLPASPGSGRRRGFWPVEELLLASSLPPGWLRLDALRANGPWRRTLAAWVASGAPRGASRADSGVGPAAPGGLNSFLRGLRGPRGLGGPQGSQKARGRRARSAAVRGSLRLAAPGVVEGATVILVDDVMTTGATLAEAARVLRSGGARVVAAAVVAAVPAPSTRCADG